MNEDAATELMTLPFRDWIWNEDFVRACDQMQCDCLEDVLRCSPQQLVALPGFSYAWLGELTGLLEAKGLLHLLQAKPGKSSV